MADQAVWLIKSDYALLQTYPKSTPLTAPQSLQATTHEASLMLEDLPGKKSESGAIPSFSVSTATLKPAAQNSHSDGPHARATPSMGDAEGLVKI